MTTPTTFKGLVDFFLNFINYLVPFIFAIVFIFVIWKVIDAWVINAGDEKKRAEGKNFIIVGVLVFVLMFSVWGIIAMLRRSLFGI